MKNAIFLFSLLFVIPFSFKAQVLPSTEICLVTVDSNSTHNIVVWERVSQTSNNPIDSIKIYRVTLLGTDTLVGAVHWDSLSEFHDYSADPNLKFYRYRISAVNDLGVEGAMSFPHQTMHFGLLAQGDSIRLRWTPYIGKPFSVYDCMIDSAGGPQGWEWVNSTSNNIDTNWWDKSTPSNWANLSYLVKLSGMTQCTSTKAQDHNTTRSNRATMTEPNPNNIVEEMDFIKEVMVYPNPTSGQAKLVFSSKSWSPIQIYVTDFLGRKVIEYSSIKVLGQHTHNINLSQLDPGIYQVVIQGASRLYSTSLLKL